MASTITSTFSDFMQELTLPFKRLASHEDPLVNGLGNDSISWHSLFPNASDEQHSTAAEATLQADWLHEPLRPLSPPSSQSSTSSPSSPMMMTHGISQEEVDPEWLTFLDEASPLVSTTETESSLSAMDEESPTNPSSLNKGLRNWTEDYLKTSALNPTGHNSLTLTGSIGSLGISGGFKRNLNGGHQPKMLRFHTKASSRKSAGSGSSAKRKKGSSSTTVNEKVTTSTTTTTTTTQNSSSENKLKKLEARTEPSPPSLQHPEVMKHDT
ncbi:hypothetical protein BGZ65_011617, partial [Modicella reniformis]